MGLDEAEVFHAGSREWISASKRAAEVMPRLWDRPRKPTAIFAISDAAAVGTLYWLHSHHVSVPEEVSLLSYGGSAWTRETLPELTSVVTPVERVVAESFRLLLSESGKAEHCLVAPDFQVGGTLAPPSEL